MRNLGLSRFSSIKILLTHFVTSRVRRPQRAYQRSHLVQSVLAPSLWPTDSGSVVVGRGAPLLGRVSALASFVPDILQRDLTISSRR